MLDLDALSNGSYKLIHSMGMRFPTSLPSGRLYQIRYHQTIRSVDIGIHRWPDDIHVLVGDDAEPLLEYAQLLGRAVKKSALGIFSSRKNPLGQPATPIIVGIDELIALDAAMGSAQGKDSARWFRKLLISLRHEHIALLAGIQDSNCASYITSGLATKLWCFNTTHRYAITALEAGGMPKEQVAALPRLRKGEHIEVNLSMDDEAPAGAHEPKALAKEPERSGSGPYR